MRLTPISQKELIKRFRHLGWKGPEYRSDHPFMLKDGHPPQKIPNPHGEDISVDLVARILRQAEISREEWLNAR
jgi:predicted RNA binding protein YcfA (HicA-like mRNA interferase family)